MNTTDPNSATPKNTTSSRRNGGALVLIVDDDITSTRILQSILIKEGFAVITAENGIAAKELALSNLPDLSLIHI